MTEKKTYIDPTAEVHIDAKIEPGVSIWNWTKIRENAYIGEDSTVGQSSYIEYEVTIGKRCKIQNGVSVYHGVTIGNDVFVGPNATFTNDRVPRAHSPHWAISRTIVEDGASIGANATILCGITLGKHCMIAAGAVVTKDVPPHALVMGHPARVVDYVTVKGQRINVDNPEQPPSSDVLMDREL